MMSNPTTGGPSPIRMVSILILIFGVVSLSGALWLRSMASKVAITSVILTPSLESGGPGLKCRVKGYNPLPIDVEMRHLRMTVGQDVMPVGMELSSSQYRMISAGEFQVEMNFEADANSLSIIAGQGLSILFGRSLDYEIRLKLGRGPLEHSLKFDGELSPGL